MLAPHDKGKNFRRANTRFLWCTNETGKRVNQWQCALINNVQRDDAGGVACLTLMRMVRAGRTRGLPRPLSAGSRRWKTSGRAWWSTGFETVLNGKPKRHFPQTKPAPWCGNWSCHTPKRGSWLNIAENELSCITRQCISHRRFASTEELRVETTAWSQHANARQHGVDWHFKIDDVRIKL
ncbi:MAG: hypothetical protein ACAI35_07360 [Candidatus Methylacidiphilales bacterium]|nr:hypothetical protein [Candidatus Methylacidiphilales bacterium]